MTFFIWLHYTEVAKSGLPLWAELDGRYAKRLHLLQLLVLLCERGVLGLLHLMCDFLNESLILSVFWHKLRPFFLLLPNHLILKFILDVLECDCLASVDV